MFADSNYYCLPIALLRSNLTKYTENSDETGVILSIYIDYWVVYSAAIDDQKTLPVL